MPEKPDRTATDILKDLHEFVSGPEEDFATAKMSSVDAVLADAGIDASSAFRSIRNSFARSRAEEKLADAGKKKQLFDRLVSAYREQKKPLQGTVSRGKEALERLAAFRPGEPAVAFHKLKEATREDLESLADDLDLLEALNRGDAGLDER